jgi:hypothetical protein
MKKLILFSATIFLLLACSPGKPKDEAAEAKKENPVAEVADPTKGIGQIKNVNLHTPLELDRVERGKAIYEMKCSACHKLTDQRVVGPGWLGVTKTRKPEWIMNMIRKHKSCLNFVLPECQTKMFPWVMQEIFLSSCVKMMAKNSQSSILF